MNRSSTMTILKVKFKHLLIYIFQTPKYTYLIYTTVG